MLLTDAQAIATIRRFLNDASGGRRLGENWTDQEIRECFTRHYYDNVVDYVRGGLCHYVAPMLRVVVAGQGTLNYDASNPNTVIVTLPRDFLLGVSAGIGGRNVPLYHLADDVGSPGTSYPLEMRDFGLYIYRTDGEYVARLFWDDGHLHLPDDMYIVIVYVTSEYRLGNLVSDNQLHSWYLHQNAVLDTVCELMESDAGGENSPVLSIVRAMRMPDVLETIQSNGTLKIIPTVTAR